MTIIRNNYYCVNPDQQKLFRKLNFREVRKASTQRTIRSERSPIVAWQLGGLSHEVLLGSQVPNHLVSSVPGFASSGGEWALR